MRPGPLVVASAVVVASALLPRVCATLPNIVALPLTEPETELDAPLPPWPEPPPPPPPREAMRTASREVEGLGWPDPHNTAVVPPSFAVVARTRLTTSAVEAGATALHVKMSSGFHSGGLVVINPGGPTEERNKFVRQPFVLASPLKHQHGLGEIVLMLAPQSTGFTADVHTEPSLVKAAAPRPAWDTAVAHGEKPLLGRCVHSLLVGRLGVARARRRHPHLSPDPSALDAPTLRSLSELQSTWRSKSFVRVHWGVEAAAGMLIALLLVLLVATCVVQSFCEYNPFCFLGRKGPREIRRARPPRRGFPACATVSARCRAAPRRECMRDVAVTSRLPIVRPEQAGRREERGGHGRNGVSTMLNASRLTVGAQARDACIGAAGTRAFHPQALRSSAVSMPDGGPQSFVRYRRPRYSTHRRAMTRRAQGTVGHGLQ